jgi:hypothetical protein
VRVAPFATLGAMAGESRSDRHRGWLRGLARQAGAASALASAALAGAAFAQEPGSAQPAGETEGPGGSTRQPGGVPSPPAPAVDLDALLRLPSAAGEPAPVHDAAERMRWEERFRDVRDELDTARSRLAQSQRELGELAAQSDAWQVAAPGAQNTPENSPISYKLRQEIRERREDVDRAERRLRELEIEAGLAGIPPDWRAAPPEEPAPGS